MARRIAWLEPGRLPFGSDDQNIYSGVLFPRAGPKMAALLRERGDSCTVISGELSPIDVDQIAQSFDLACLSMISVTAPHSLILARQLSERGLPVVLGGYQFAHNGFSPETLAPTEEGLGFAPCVVRGEGYRTLPELLDALDGRRPLASVGGLSFRDSDGACVHNAPAALLSREQIDALPPADWTVVRDRHRMRVAAVHGQQGCPRECSFCAVWTRDGRRNRNTAPRLVVDELEAVLGAGRFRHVFFSADNFPVFRDWAGAICDEMVARGIRIGWTCQAEVGTVRHTELVDRMVAAGCERWCIGLESVNPAALADSRKRQNLEQMEACIREVHRRGIQVHGMFIVGLPHDTPETIRETCDWARRHRLETVQFLCLSDLPGSPDYERHELWKTAFRPFGGALEPLNWMFVNGHYARVRNEAMDHHAVQEASISAMRCFYGLGRALAPLAGPRIDAVRAWRARGAGRLRALAEGYKHSAETAYLRLRGHRDMGRWLRSPLNRAYRELLTAGPERAAELKQRLLDLLPADWLPTLERVYAERRARPQPRLVPQSEAAG